MSVPNGECDGESYAEHGENNHGREEKRMRWDGEVLKEKLAERRHLAGTSKERLEGIVAVLDQVRWPVLLNARFTYQLRRVLGAR
jgi:hypothetical protein